MFLKHLSLFNYKNFESGSFDFDAKINCLVGPNGVGKTNVLDAIYHLCFGKGYFNSIATQNIKHDEAFFVINGEFEKEGRDLKIVCSLKRGAKRIIKNNGKVYDRLSDHIGQIPLVIISPADRDLITEGSDTRRKFIDGVIAQSDKAYLQNLIRYNKVLAQRNSLLKYFAANHTFDAASLEVYDEQLHTFGSKIYATRKAFLSVFVPIFKEQHKAISGNSEAISLNYDSKLHDYNLHELLKSNLNRDRALQYTSVGIHKDDLAFEIEHHPIKKFGSQGQQKSYLIALKFAQFQFLKVQSKTSPILLLDDIFDKLDENRVAHIVSLVNDAKFGQIFISDTHQKRTEQVVEQTNQPYKMFNLSETTNAEL